MEWFKAIVKVMDIPNTIPIIITSKRVLDDRILSLLDRYGIRLVMLDGITIADAIVRGVDGIVCKV